MITEILAAILVNEIKSYRLGEYRIAEYNNVLLSWERHAALAEQYSGKCFIHGDVLIIGDRSHQEPGYLIGEFLEQLQKLPAWNKTRYYCLASTLLDVKTGLGLTNNFLTYSLSSVNSAGLKSNMTLGQGTFRLGQYQITVTDNYEVYWQTYEGLNKIAGGRCIIESALLFISSKEYGKEGQSKEDFLDKLTRLPKWDKTVAWSYSKVLLPCQQEPEKDKTRSAIGPERKGNNPFYDTLTATKRRYQYKETATKFLSSCVKRITASWQRVHVRRVWKKYLIPLLIMVLAFVIIIILFSQDGILHHWAKEHHHKHHD